MSDPLSVAGSAVGVVSLGLQVCGQIVSFCQTWRGFNEDIQNIMEKAEALQMPLKSLQEMIEDSRSTDPAMASDLEKKAMSIERAIRRLERATDRYKSAISSDVNGLRFQLKKGTYPFRKEGLREMASDLDSVQVALQTALQVYSMHDRAHLGKIIQELQDVKSQLKALPQGYMLPPSSLQSLCVSQQRLPPPESWGQHGAQLDQTRTSPSLNSDPNDPTFPGQEKMETQHGTSITRQSRSPVNSRSTSRSRQLVAEKDIIKLSYHHCSRILNVAIRMSFSFTRGAGGYSIAPLLHLTPLVDRANSLSYRILKDFLSELDKVAGIPDSPQLLLDRTKHRLQEAFDLQQASPFDSFGDSSGEYSLLELFPHAFRPGLSEYVFKLFGFLLDCGCKPNIDYGGGPLYWWMEYGIFNNEGDIGWRLLEAGYRYPVRVPWTLAKKRDLCKLVGAGDESIEIPNIVSIIMRRSENELIDALATGKSSPNEMINGRESLIEFAYGWPKGMQILLEAGAALDWANLGLPYVEDDESHDTYYSVKLLLDAGCPFDWLEIARCQNSKHSGNIKSLLIDDLVARRKNLWRLARSCLPRELPPLISNEETEGTSTILDIHTVEIIKRLRDRGIDFQLEYESENFGSVYHYPTFSADTLEELYQAGFRGVDELDSDGFMPLLCVHVILGFEWGKYRVREMMKRMAWLISKGADPYRIVPGSSATAAHHTSLRIIECLLEYLWMSERDPLLYQAKLKHSKRTVSEFGKQVFLPSVRDGCVCACSDGGCTPMSVVLWKIIRQFSWVKLIDLGPLFRELIEFLIEWTGEDEAVTLGVISIRGPGSNLKVEMHRDAEEVKEIHEEERFRLVDLELLLEEFEAKFEDLGQSVVEFLEEHWHTRMIEFLSQRDSYDEEHDIGTRSLGVKLEPDEELVPHRASLLIGSKIKEVSS